MNKKTSDQRLNIHRFTEKGQKIAQSPEISRREKFNSILANIPENRQEYE